MTSVSRAKCYCRRSRWHLILDVKGASCKSLVVGFIEEKEKGTSLLTLSCFPHTESKLISGVKKVET